MKVSHDIRDICVTRDEARVRAMARTVRDSKLDSRTARLKLSKGARHWRQVTDGLTLVYRRTEAGYGTWFARYRNPETSKVILTRLGAADDHAEADGDTVLTFAQAQQKSQLAMHTRSVRRRGVGYTVENACADYLDWYKAHRKASGYRSTWYAIELHIKPKFGDDPVSGLTAEALRRWHRNIAIAPPRVRSSKLGEKQLRHGEPDPRARKATANRVLTILKAALNQAAENDKTTNVNAWRNVKPFGRVDAPKIRHLSPAECKRLLNACAKDFRLLVQAALLTGCRYGELTHMTGGDYHAEARTILVRETKNGRPRHVPLTDEGSAFFERQAAGKATNGPLLTKGHGGAWGYAHQLRPMLTACKAANIDPPVSFHILRHTYGSSLAMNQVPLQVIAAALGHADTRITERHYAHLSPSYVADMIRTNLPILGIESDNVAPLKQKSRAVRKHPDEMKN